MSNKARWRNYTKQELAKIVKESKSNRDVARALGYSANGGGTMQSLNRMYKQLNLDTSHFLGQGWNKNNYSYETFSNGTYKKRGKSSLEPLIHLRGRKCENCGLTEWMGKEINLEIHHIDGDRLNNDLSNLQLLCPNCHSNTFNWRKSVIKKNIPEEDFVNALKNNKNIRQALLSLGLSGTGGNYSRARELIEKYNISHLQKEHQNEKSSE